MKLKKVVIIGMGLIGGSIGKALIARDLAEEVVGVCRRESSLERAIKEKSLTKGFVNNYEEATSGAEVVIIATPVHTIKDVLKGLSEVSSLEGAIVTDVGSTKQEIVDYAANFSNNFTFIGSHPLAGSEKTGVEASVLNLFDESVCVVTTDGAQDEKVVLLKKFWEALGAEVSVMTAQEHDRTLAFTSHLPHIVAYTLAGIQNKDFFKYMATGFKDTTRIASSDAGLWTDIFLSNKENVVKSINVFKEMLEEIEKKISTGDESALKAKLDECRRLRDDAV